MLQFPLRPPNSRISDLSMSALRSDQLSTASNSQLPDQDESDIDRFDWVPDSLVLLIFNRIGDVKTLGRCCVVSKRFHYLVPQVDNVVVKVNCVISDDDNNSGSTGSSVDKPRGVFASLFRALFGGIIKPFQALGQVLGPRRSVAGTGVAVGSDEVEEARVTHHSPTQVLKNFNEIRFLKIDLPSGELGIDDGVLLKWRAEFGSTLDKCVILGGSSIVYPDDDKESEADRAGVVVGVGDDNGRIPESFYTNGGLKLRVVWTISSLIAASARHYLLQPIIAEHRTLDNLVLTDADGQGVLCMNRDQLDELRVKPLSASAASKRTIVPALTMRLWYATSMELPDGVVLKGATLVAIRPSEHVPIKKDVCDLSWVADTFEEPYGMAVRMLMKRRTYSLEMNSF